MVSISLKDSDKAPPDSFKPPFLNIRVSGLGASVLALLALLGTYLYWHLPSPTSTFTHNNFAYLAKHCAHVNPIGFSEFHQRQDALAKTLQALNASAYIAEPGASAQFFGNISGSQWHLSERPLLLMISPEKHGDKVTAKVFVLTPSFEATRAKLLNVPTSNVTYVEWQEDKDPYAVAVAAIPSLLQENATVFVDSSIRNFIVDGLQHALPSSSVVRSAPLQIRQLRERKSTAELALLKCANEVTLLAIREVRKRMFIGMHESQGRQLVQNALLDAGLTDTSLIVLFGENAALPHGAGTDRVLGKSDFILIDCGGSLYGYHSDVTRTFALHESKIPENHRQIWDHVHAAQTNASIAARQGAVTSQVDRVARTTITAFGFGPNFTHRLGHGIGLEVHEEPYLRGGTNDTIEVGHTFSNEPGIYIEKKVGVRLEDCFYIEENGQSTFLTAGVGGQAIDPWHP